MPLNDEKNGCKMKSANSKKVCVLTFSFYLCGLYDVWHRESPLEKGARGL
jgi:hypothetical protein